MSVALFPCPQGESRYNGLRMSADEYLRLEDDGCRYELIDGVVCMSPSPTPGHQNVEGQVFGQIWTYLERHPVGAVLTEVDVRLPAGPNGEETVYRPDVVFLRAERVTRNRDRITEPPDLIVEIISITSRHYDQETKKSDYERFGVREYWIIDPIRETMGFYRLREDRYVEVKHQGDAFLSEAVPGFVLDLARVRKAFRLG